MYGRIKRRAGFFPVHTFNDNRVIAHAAADESALFWKSGRCSFPHNPELLAVVFFAPGEIVMIVDLFYDLRSEDATCHTLRYSLASGVGVAACQGHRRQVIGAKLGTHRHDRRRHIHAIFTAGCL